VARPTKDQRLAEVHATALARFNTVESTGRDQRHECLQDRRFYSLSGAQWEGDYLDAFQNRPRIEVNKIHLSVMRIINEYRNNRISVDFVSADGTPDDALSDLCDGLYRADEQRSNAQEAYDNAFEEAVGGGFGAWRLRAEYEDEYDDDNDYQRICIEPIFDADSSVYFDLGAKRQDKADAKFCFVLTSYDPEQYTEEYGDSPTTWPKDVTRSQFDWATPDVVYVAEYYVVEDTREKVFTYRTLLGDEEKHTETELEDDPDLAARLNAIGTRKTGEKSVKRRAVHKYLMSGGGVLEDCGHLAGRNIPIIPVYGKRWFIDNIERYMGHVRLAKDAQRLKNMQLSKLAEMASMSVTEKPIFTPEQVQGVESYWQDDNLQNYPYLVVNPIIGVDGQAVAQGPLGFTKPPAIAPATAALLQIAEQDMQDILGNQAQGEEMSTQMSGKAVELVQNRLDMQSFIYMSNLSKAMRRCGEVWLGMAKELMVEKGRRMKSLGEQGETETAVLMTPMQDAETGAMGYANDLSRANLDVVVDVGPSSQSRRSATVRALTGMMQIAQDPETLQVLSAVSLMNMEGEGLAEVRKWYRRKLVTMGVMDPTKDEEAEMAAAQQGQQPNPQALLLEAAAKEAEAKAIHAEAQAGLAVARTEQAKADTAATLAGISREDQAQAVATAQAIAKAISERAIPATGMRIG